MMTRKTHVDNNNVAYLFEIKIVCAAVAMVYLLIDNYLLSQLKHLITLLHYYLIKEKHLYSNSSLLLEAIKKVN